MADPHLDNSSNTPRNEVGGLALFDGVMMRSRTGFAIAMRQRNGLIRVAQFPFASSLGRGPGRVPLLRGVASLAEMMAIATRALGYSAEEEEDRRLESMGARTWLMLVCSTVVLVLFIVLAPNAIAQGALGWLSFQFPAAREWLGPSIEADSPFVFNLVAGALRLCFIVAYIAAISLSAEIRDVFRYHGAEHKAAHALERGRGVTVDRAREESVLHPRCGTVFLAVLAVAAAVVFALTDAALALYLSGFPEWPLWERKALSLPIHLALLVPVVGLAFELVKWASARPGNLLARGILWPGLLLQRMTTREPDDRRLEVAIVALLAALAIPPGVTEPTEATVRGLEDDESAPAYVQRSPARVAPPPRDDEDRGTSRAEDGVIPQE